MKKSGKKIPDSIFFNQTEWDYSFQLTPRMKQRMMTVREITIATFISTPITESTWINGQHLNQRYQRIV